MVAKWALDLFGEHPVICLFQPDSLAVGTVKSLSHALTSIAVIAWDELFIIQDCLSQASRIALAGAILKEAETEPEFHRSPLVRFSFVFPTL